MENLIMGIICGFGIGVTVGMIIGEERVRKIFK